MVKALDIRSGGDYVQVRFLAWAMFFLFFNDDGGALRSDACERKAQALIRVQSTNPEGTKRPRMRAQSAKSGKRKQSTTKPDLREQSDRECQREARSQREQSDRVDVPE